MSGPGEVAAQLTRHLAAAELEDPWTDGPGRTTRTQHLVDAAAGDEVYTADRESYQQDVVDDLFDAGSADRSGAATLVLTAGPPGAGKTRLLRDRLPELAGFREVDPDVVKDRLLTDARDGELLAPLLAPVLADGRPVQLRELSNVVHAESTIVAEALRDRALAAREDLVLQGSLYDLAPIGDLLDLLQQRRYGLLRIVHVEVDRATAVQRVQQRWWDDRCDEHEPLGGRFISPDALDRYFDADDRSWSRRNVDDVAARVRAGYPFEVRVERY